MDQEAASLIKSNVLFCICGKVLIHFVRRTPNKMIGTFGVILLLCVPVAVTAQIRFSDPTNRNQAKQMCAKVERTLKEKEERKWKLKLILESEFGSHYYFKSGKNEIEFFIFVYDSPEEASKQLRLHADGSSITAPTDLKDIGDEAFYMAPRYFSWIGVRKGRMLVEVRGPGPYLTVTRRFVGYGLEEIDKALGAN